MTVNSNGTGGFKGEVVRGDDLDKTVLWRGNTLPTSANCDVPNDAIFLKIDTGVFYRNTGTMQNPVWSKINSGAEPGTITDFAGLESKIPLGYLRCNGAILLKSQYSDLYDAIGDNWGSIDSTHFNLPDLETDNRFTRAADSDNELGETGGEDSHTLTKSEMPSHNHIISPNPHAHSYTAPEITNNTGQYTNSQVNSAVGSTTGSVNLTVNDMGGDIAHENKPPYASVYKIIKT